MLLLLVNAAMKRSMFARAVPGSPLASVLTSKRLKPARERLSERAWAVVRKRNSGDACAFVRPPASAAVVAVGKLPDKDPRAAITLPALMFRIAEFEED